MPLSERDYNSGALLFHTTKEENEMLNIMKKNRQLEKEIKNINNMLKTFLGEDKYNISNQLAGSDRRR